MTRYRYRKVHGWSAVALLIVSLLVWYGQQQGWLDRSGHFIARNQPGSYSINHFIDGDTIAVNMNGHVEEVRFIGIDTPETHKPNTPVQCFGPQAANFTKSEIGHQSVRLVADSLSTNRDRYDRLLRYVYLVDGTNLNERLVQQGYAFYYPYFSFSKSTPFASDEQAAIRSHLGLWKACHPTPSDNGGYKMEEPDPNG